MRENPLDVLTPAGKLLMIVLLFSALLWIGLADDSPLTECDERSISDCHMREHHE